MPEQYCMDCGFVTYYCYYIDSVGPYCYDCYHDRCDNNNYVYTEKKE